MNLDIIRDVFLMGSNEEKERFIEKLKTRCIQVSDKTISVDGTVEKLIFNTENNTYFDRWMHLYRACPVCGKIKPISDFVTCTILPGQTYRHEGERLKRKEEVICMDCLEEGNFVVPCKIINYSRTAIVNYMSYYLYKNPDESIDDDHKTVEFGYRDEEGNFVHGFTFSNELARHSRNRFLYRWNYETDSLDDFGYVFFQIENEVEVRIPGRSDYVYMLREEVEAHPEIWKKCSHCGKWHHHSLILENGMCKKCDAEVHDVEIYPYHGWTRKTKFMSSDSEVVDDHTLYLGLEIEVQGDRSNKNLVRPIADIFHLESDSSISRGGFEMISQPMTFKYLVENIDRIKSVLDALSEAGMLAHDTNCCGLHIHTSAAAYKNYDSMCRAGAIVNALRSEFEKFARRKSEHYCSYYNTSEFPTQEEISALTSGDRYHSVNFENVQHRNWKKTVEYRIFRSTTVANTIMASAQIVVNIVNIANSNQHIVKFGDLLHGEYIDKYVEERKAKGVTFDTEKKVFFGFDNVLRDIQNQIKNFNPDACRDIIASYLREITESAVEESAVLSD